MSITIQSFLKIFQCKKVILSEIIISGSNFSLDCLNFFTQFTIENFRIFKDFQVKFFTQISYLNIQTNTRLTIVNHHWLVLSWITALNTQIFMISYTATYNGSVCLRFALFHLCILISVYFDG